MKRSKGFLLSCVIAAVGAMCIFLSGCNFNGGLSVTAYVDQVSDNIHESVNLTRQYKKLSEKLDTRNAEDAKAAVEILDKLSDCYSRLLELQAPDRYNDIDDDLKKNAGEALADVSQLKSLINNSQTTGSDSLFKTDSQRIMAHYETIYNELTDINSQTRTRYRND